MARRQPKKKPSVDPERMAQMLAERNTIADFIEWMDENEADFDEDTPPLEIATAYVATSDEEEDALENVLNVLEGNAE